MKEFCWAPSKLRYQELSKWNGRDRVRSSHGVRSPFSPQEILNIITTTRHRIYKPLGDKNAWQEQGSWAPRALRQQLHREARSRSNTMAPGNGDTPAEFGMAVQLKVRQKRRSRNPKMGLATLCFRSVPSPQDSWQETLSC